MHARSSLSEAQREAVVALFEKGVGYGSAARSLDAARVPVRALYGRWRIHGQGVLVSRLAKSYSFEFKLALVERFLAGESGPDLAVEAGLASRELLQKWVRAYRLDGEDGLRPKPKGRPRKPDSPPPAELPELERLRRENERLRAEVAYLGKLRALREQGRR
ncbi:transposase [Pseudarthrobacter sulfonivorans]|uniref:Transposase n=1 Tax=Pseudarthrobacter sulfonivorans TaxID=121292 RepID=A0A0U3P0C9_9MICC|nr:transposase [Pseudarthrobacter sulfonivorans]